MMERQTSGPMQKSPSKSVGRKDEYTCEEVDSLSEQFEQIARRQMLSQGQVKLRATERDLLAVAENIRDKLKVAVSGEKGQLAEVFGGDCRRFHRIRCVLDEVKLSDMHASDRRWPDVAVQMDIIEQVLKELGLYKPWVPKKKAPECLRYLGVRSRITPGDKVFLRPEFEACEDVVFTVEPPLPAGLELDPSNGRITGELDAELAVGLQTYVVTARNEGGEASFELAFAVAPPAPGTIAYPVMAAEQLFVGEVVRIVPERGGGHPKEWSVDPELPEGLIISPGTGEITGVPVALAPVAAYLVTAANAGGKVSVPLQLGVAHAPPLCLSYPDLQGDLMFGTVVFLRPDVVLQTSTAQTVGRRLWNFARMRTLQRLRFACMPKMEYSIEPALPEGLFLARSTGIITGVPAAKTEPTIYKVGVSSAAGEAVAELSFAVRLLPPSGLAYQEADARYFTSQAISLVPEVTGLVESWDVEPPLPPGLKLHPSRGTISGSLEDQVLPESTWTVTARNSEGEGRTTLTFTVVRAPPSGLAYPTLAKEFPMSALPVERHVSVRPTVTGQVSRFTVEPELPAGLALDSETGEVSGCAEGPSARATYKVTAENETGSTTLELTFSVKLMRPESLSYPEKNIEYTVGQDVSIEPSVHGRVSAWAVDPALPAGLSLDISTGVVRGVPKDPAAAASYIVTATNEAGEASFELRMAVREPAPQGLAYPECLAEYFVGQEVYMAPELETGNCVHFSVEPGLPEGLYLDPTSGIISGKLAAEASAESYVVTGRTQSSALCTVELVFTCMEPAKTDALVTQKFAEQVDEITKIEDLMEEPGKGKVLGDWLVWMVHRVHLNDPSLTELNFANVWMPLGHTEPRIAPKLVKAIAHNTHLVTLQLSHTNLQKPEGQLLAESLKANETLQFLNVESNSLDSHTIRRMAEALSENPRSALEVWRFNNQKHIGRYFGRPVEETVADMMEKNQRICKLGFAVDDANSRLKIDRAILRNMDFARKRRRRGADGEEGDEVTAEEKRMSRLILRDAPARPAAEVFGDDVRLGLVRKHVAEKGIIPASQALQAWAKGQGTSIPYSAVKPLLEDFRTKLLNATIECQQQVSVQDVYGAEFSGSLRAWTERNSSWSLDVWPSGDRRFNFTSDQQLTIEVSGSFKDWLQPLIES
mmetsp:Transcript_94151/g.263037  ORF Transcript_94151/g.263037 Transcript_94151/m.263037 type:complete len:1162 (+) Transcript_94151:119-3604(+)